MNSFDDEIIQFLCGEMSEQESADFLNRARTNPALRQQLQQEVALDAALSSCAIPQRQLLDPGSVEQLLSRAQPKTVRQPLLRAAAVILLGSLLVGGGYALGVLTAPATHAGTLATSAPSARSGAAMASPVLWHPTQQELTGEGKVFMLIGNHGSLLAERGASLKIHNRSDSSCLILHKEGSALYNFQMKATETVTIMTPHGVVRATQGIMRIAVNELETELWVYRGQAELQHHQDKDSVQTVHEGQLGALSAWQCTVATLDNSALIGFRKALFSKYVAFLNQGAVR